MMTTCSLNLVTSSAAPRTPPSILLVAPVGGRLHDVLVEPVHLVGRADAQGGALIHAVDLHVEDGPARDPVARLPPGPLHEESEGRRLEREAELGRAFFRGGVAEHALSLGE